MSTENKTSQVAVLGGGPGGYAAAFMAADLGLTVSLIDTDANPGGVCVRRGCIPSKALLHIAKLLHEAREARNIGVEFAEPKLDIDKIRDWKEQVVTQMTRGTGQLAKSRKVNYVQGHGKLTGPNAINVDLVDGGKETVTADYIILATGSRPITLPFQPQDSPRVMDSTLALELKDIPETLLVVGGGYIGLELGSAYAALGSKVTVVEMTDHLARGTDRDLVRILTKRLNQDLEAVLTETKVTAMTDTGDAVKVTMEGPKVSEPEQTFAKVLVAVNRQPNTENIGLENTKVELTERGFIKVDKQLRTTEANIFAIGDLTGDPMLAHKATHEGRTAAEVIAGHPSEFEPAVIPSVFYTDPEIAYAGLTETEAKAQNRNVEIARFSWAASGRATTLNRNDGVTKLIIDPLTERVLGMGIAGPGAGELIAEGVLAIEMAAVASDIGMSIHPHPTLTESVMESADVFYGNSTHVYRPKRKKK
ncbi:MAG: dihydrolipoyl dehydrogenase [Chloroflexota bacterium]